jgi:c-di-GMP-binding flagellar brake protein YcgR
MTQDQQDMLTQAVERNSAAVLALPSAGMFRYHKTRFLRGVDDRLWLESVAEDQQLINSLIQTGTPAVVSYKFGQMKASFSAPILELDGQYRFFDAQEPIQAIMMTRPALVKPIQRRTNYRVTLRPEDGFRLQLWRINDTVDVTVKPTDICEIPVMIQNLSVGGVGVMFKEKPLLMTGQRLRVLLSWGERPPMILEGRSGQVRQENGSPAYITGVQFQNLQGTLEGRRFLTELTKTVSALQLEEAKRLRKARPAA